MMISMEMYINRYLLFLGVGMGLCRLVVSLFSFSTFVCPTTLFSKGLPVDRGAVCV